MSDVKDLMTVNKNGQKKKAKKKSASHGKKKTTRKAGKRKSHSTTKSTRKTRRARRRNPGMDLRGNGAAFLGGMAGELLSKPIGALVRKKVENKILLAAVDAIAPAGVGLLAGRWLPNVGKGMVAAGGANAVEHAMNALTYATPGAPNPTLKTLGYGSLGDPRYSVRDGVVIEHSAQGERALSPIDGRKVQLALDDGSTQVLTLAHDLGGGSAIVLDERGQPELLSGLGDIGPENATTGDVEPENATTGDVEPENATTGDDEGLGDDDDGLGDDDGLL